MLKPKISLIITDLDNTLFDWVDIWYNSFSAMKEKILEISGVSEDALLKEIKPTYALKQSFKELLNHFDFVKVS